MGGISGQAGSTNLSLALRSPSCGESLHWTQKPLQAAESSPTAFLRSQAADSAVFSSSGPLQEEVVSKPEAFSGSPRDGQAARAAFLVYQSRLGTSPCPVSLRPPQGDTALLILPHPACH